MSKIVGRIEPDSRLPMRLPTNSPPSFDSSARLLGLIPPAIRAETKLNNLAIHSANH